MNMPPDMLLNNRYRIERMLGQGGMGAVYLAFDTALDAAVALKANQNAAPQSSNQFLREARLLASLRHPNLPRVTDYFILNDTQYLVMDYVAGKDLNTVLHEEGAQPLERVLSWAGELCKALSYLHSQTPPVIHRDVKPANVRLTPDGEVILVDFGIAKVFDPGQQTTTTGAMGYTPGYAPPEQYGGSVHTGPYTDQYSLAALLYHLLTAQKPAVSVQRAIGAAALTPLRLLKPIVPPHVEAAVERALSLRPDERFPSIDDFLLALTTPASFPDERNTSMVISSRPPEPLTPTVVSPSRPVQATITSQVEMAVPTQALAPPKRGPNWLLIGGVGMLVLLGLGAAALLAGGRLLAWVSQKDTPAATSTVVAAAAATSATHPQVQPTNTSAPLPATQTTSPPVAASDTPAPASTATDAPSPTTHPTDTLQPSPAALAIGGGGRLAFASDRGGDALQIWTMRISLNDQGQMITSDLKQITHSPGDKSQPGWSPDGKRLLYIAPGGPDGKLDIWMVNSDGSGEPKDLTNLKGNETEPAWSPDGKWIAFTSDKWTGSVLQIYLIRPDGSEYYRLSYDQREYGAAWKPDNQLAFIMDTGLKIVFIRGQKDPKTGAKPTQEFYVTPYRFDTMSFVDNLGDAVDPAWSPDGKWLAYTRLGGRNSSISLSHYPLRVPAQEVIKLTDTGKDANPTWSPDGQWIAFTSTRDGNAEVYIMRSTGQSQANLSNSPGQDKDPAWQPAAP
jgi:serine/threonine protein kinase/Tol biopolymer transport system component